MNEIIEIYKKRIEELKKSYIFRHGNPKRKREIADLIKINRERLLNQAIDEDTDFSWRKNTFMLVTGQPKYVKLDFFNVLRFKIESSTYLSYYDKIKIEKFLREVINPEEWL